MFRIYFKRKYILLILDGMFFINMLSSFGWMCHLRPLVFCLDNLSIDVNWVLMFHIIVLLSTAPSMSVNLHYVFRYFYVGCICICNYYISFWLIPWLSCNVLCLLWESLFDISVVTLAYFWFKFAWNTFFHPLTFSLCL